MVWLTLNPAHGTAVLEWAGLTKLPLLSKSKIADLHGVQVQVIGDRIRKVRKLSARTEISVAIRLEVSRRSHVDEDHQARKRWAWLLNCPSPQAPPRPELTLAQWRSARRAVDVLAVLGPLTAADLTECMQRIEARSRRQIAVEQVVHLLLSSGWAAPGLDDRWSPTSDIAAPSKYVALVDAAKATGRDWHTSAQMADLLLQSGYTNAGGATITHHPLLRHIRRDRWEIRQPRV